MDYCWRGIKHQNQNHKLVREIPVSQGQKWKVRQEAYGKACNDRNCWRIVNIEYVTVITIYINMWIFITR